MKTLLDSVLETEEKLNIGLLTNKDLDIKGTLEVRNALISDIKRAIENYNTYVDNLLKPTNEKGK